MPSAKEPNLSANALEVLQARYLRRGGDGEIDETPGALLARVAKAVAEQHGVVFRFIHAVEHRLHALEHAEEVNAVVLVLQLDTPVSDPEDGAIQMCISNSPGTTAPCSAWRRRSAPTAA